MPTLSFTLTVPALSEVVDAFGESYQATIDGQPNPETKQAFARTQVIALLKSHVRLYRKRTAAAAVSQVDPGIT